MINTLIIGQDINSIIYIFNTFVSKIKEIKITNVVSSIENAISIIRNNNIDLVLLNINMKNKSDINLLKYIRHGNYINKPKIIIISDRIHYAQNNENERDFIVIKKLKNSEKILKQIVKIINNMKEKKDIERRVVQELTNMGYDFKYKGTQYLFDSIIYIYKLNNYDTLNNLEKNVYKQIANKYKKVLII